MKAEQQGRQLPSLKVDKSKLRTPANYAKDKCIPIRTVYWQIEHGTLASEEIDGVPFVKVA